MNTDADRNGNTNCLHNMQCPNCGNHERLSIQMTTTHLVTDDGTDEIDQMCGNGYEWDETSACHCPVCNSTGTVEDFTITPDRQTARLSLNLEVTVAPRSGQSPQDARAEMTKILAEYLTSPESPLWGDFGLAMQDYTAALESGETPTAWGGYEGPFITDTSINI